MLTKNQILDAIKRTLASYKTNILDKEYSTKKYVDDSIANLPIKKVISAQENPIIISNLSDGIYDFGNTSYSKMFDSDTEILENILGICILYTPDQSKRVLFVNYQSRTAYSYDYRYDLDMNAKVYYTCRYSKIINIGGATTRTVIILNEIPVEGVFGIYRTNCNSLKLTESSQAVILNNGPKILLMFRSGLNNIHTYTINVFCADFPKKIVYEYDTSTSEATLISDCDYALKDYVDDSITEQITSSQATDEEVDTMLQAVLGGDYSNEQ